MRANLLYLVSIARFDLIDTQLHMNMTTGVLPVPQFTHNPVHRHRTTPLVTTSSAPRCYAARPLHGHRTVTDATRSLTRPRLELCDKFFVSRHKVNFAHDPNDRSERDHKLGLIGLVLLLLLSISD